MPGYNQNDLNFATEKDANTFLIERLNPHFETVKQVRMIDIEDREQSYRIDLIGRCRDETDCIVGFEVKRGFTFMKEYAAALKQAADYRSAMISDSEKVPRYEGYRLAAIFVFPNWNGLHTNRNREYEREAIGMEVLAAKFRVGVCGVSSGHHGLTFTMGWNRLWSAGAGWVKDAENVLFGKRQVGSVRIHEARWRNPS